MKKLCIVVPYRDREEHLKKFAPHMKETLSSQGIDNIILIVEQTPEKAFNRAKLLNVGFDFTKGEFDYYCFHDVDMLPKESDYSYCPNPTHLAARAEQFGWKLPYEGYFGGVTIFDRESFVEINGYANNYWGWGAEDDDVFMRCFYKKIKVSRKNCSYQSLQHDRRIINEEYMKNVEKLNSFQRTLNEGTADLSKEGLSTLEYQVVKEEITPDYKKITVKI